MDSDIDIEQRLDAALGLHRVGQLDRAEIEYVDVLRADPDNFDALQLLGAVLIEQNRHPDAEAFLRRAIHLEPNFPAVHYNLGVALFELKRLDESLRSFDRAIDLDPAYAEAYSGRADTLAKLRRFDEAIACCERALSLDPNRELELRSREIRMNVRDNRKSRRFSIAALS